uniref:AlNc14C243G9505 protein n=1 Tax=Albugo laibachii Nc14 TaxID=890382 RepID=F0WT19_9STRA|nr:AlNc14C243G9505 [Albugo laibachii Nc14]|eukprot:CCA24505.1 AlNc14C243G9505 [Albugo laibachii Nc14]
MEIETKKELYARVDVLYDKLKDIVDQKRAKNQEEMENIRLNAGVDIHLRYIDGIVFDVVQVEAFIFGKSIIVMGRGLNLNGLSQSTVRRWLNGLPSEDVLLLGEYVLSSGFMIEELVEGEEEESKWVCGVKYQHGVFMERVRKLLAVKEKMKRMITDAYAAMEAWLTDMVGKYREEEIRCITELTRYIRLQIEAAKDLPELIRFGLDKNSRCSAIHEKNICIQLDASELVSPVSTELKHSVRDVKLEAVESVRDTLRAVGGNISEENDEEWIPLLIFADAMARCACIHRWMRIVWPKLTHEAFLEIGAEFRNGRSGWVDVNQFFVILRFKLSNFELLRLE